MAKKKSTRAAHDRRRTQEELDIAATADAGEGIRQGLEDARKGRTQPVREFFREFEARYAGSR